MNNQMKYAFAAVVIASAITGCKKDDESPTTPPIVNQNEVITTMIIDFHDISGGSPDKQWRFLDADGDGGIAPVTTADTLLPDKVYEANLLLLNETVTPVDTASNEVLAENTLHQFFYQATGVNVNFTYADVDDNGKPIGLRTNVTTTTVSAGSVKVTLRHEPDKDGANVQAGDITNAGGSTDIEVTFPAVID